MRNSGEGTMASGMTVPEPGMRFYVAIWLGLIAIVGVEVALTFAGLPAGSLLTALLCLAVIEAGLGVMYFMHLKYERRVLLWSLIPTLVFVLVLMNHLWPDAHRLLRMKP
jgi:cytochrome c oxidase subunit IV